MSQFYFRLLSVLSVSVLCTMPVECEDAKPAPDYNKQIAPIFRKYCEGCHNTDDAEGKLVVDSFQNLLKGGKHGPAFLAGDSKSSRMIRMLTGKDSNVMPPEDNDAPTQKEIALLTAWIDAGAKGPLGKEPGRTQLIVPEIKPSNSNSKPVFAIAWSAENNVLAKARYAEVVLTTGASANIIHTLKNIPGKVNAISFASGGTRLLTASGVVGLYGEASVWDVRTGKQIQQFRGHRDTLYAAVISSDGKILATGSYDKKIILWNVQTGKQIRKLEGHNGAIFDLAFHPNSKILASASADTTIKVWEVATGIRLDTLSQPLKEQYAVMFSPDGKTILAGGADNRIRMWRFVSLTRPRINPLLYARFAHEGPILELLYSPDKKVIASLSDDRTIKFWDANRLSQLHTITHKTELPQSIAFSSDSSKLAVAYHGSSLKLHKLPSSLSIRSTGSTAKTSTKPVITNRTNKKVVELTEQEPNNTLQEAKTISVPAVITGNIWSKNKSNKADSDLFRFSAKAGEQLMIEVNAARSKSPLDSKVEVLDADGKRIKRVLLRAVRDSYFTFRGKSSDISNDYRIHNWREMELNEYLYAGGEVVKLWLYPRGPDSGFNVYPGTGKRFTYFGTTAMTHALHEPCYIVEPHPVGSILPPNGLPVFSVYYENDDDTRRELGSDSRLLFTVPTDGNYIVKLTDVRQFQGDNYTYKLSIRPRRPDFKVTLKNANPKVNAGSGKEFELKAQRIDGYNGPIEVTIENVPPGFHVTSPVTIQAGHDVAYGIITAEANAPKPTTANESTSVVIASAVINGEQKSYPVNSLEKIELLPAPKIKVRLLPANSNDQTKLRDVTAAVAQPLELVIHPGETISADVRVARNNYKGVIKFGREFAGRNMPHGVYVDNIGLSGLTLLDNQNKRTFFVTAAKWVPETTRLFHLTTSEDGKQTSLPVILHVRKREIIID